MLVIERIDKEKERKKNEEKRKTSLNFLIAIYFQKFEIFEKKKNTLGNFDIYEESALHGDMDELNKMIMLYCMSVLNTNAYNIFLLAAR